MIDRRGVIASAVALSTATKVGANEDTAALLHRHTQELMDAIPAGNAEVWSRLLHSKAVLTDEGGVVSDKAKIVGRMTPFPPRITGRIQVIDFAARVHGDTAIVTYISDEHEGYYAAKLHCQYRSTDTWQRTAGTWQLIASQVLALRTDPPTTMANAAERAALIGDYALAPDKRMTIARVENGLTLTELGGAAKPFQREAGEVWFVPGSPRYRYIVERDPSAKVIAIIQRREAWDLRWLRA